MKKILIMGLPGSGKTTLASCIVGQLIMHFGLPNTVIWLNADQVRQRYNDWDFSPEGRIRQANRMRMLADESKAQFVVVDFVAPLPEMRKIFDADYTVWLDTKQPSAYADTVAAFIPPEIYDIRVTEQDAKAWAARIVEEIIEE